MTDALTATAAPPREAEQPKPEPKPRDGCYLCGDPDAFFRVGTKVFCGRSCAEDYCL